MPNPWQSYASISDDVRHTYERVFFGRQTTGDLTVSDMPGIGPQAEPGETSAAPEVEPAAAAADSPAAALYGPAETAEARQATATAYEHAANAPGIRAEMDAVNGTPYGWANAPDRTPAPQIEAAPIEAPEIGPTAPVNDMTPG